MSNNIRFFKLAPEHETFGRLCPETFSKKSARRVLSYLYKKLNNKRLINSVLRETKLSCQTFIKKSCFTTDIFAELMLSVLSSDLDDIISYSDNRIPAKQRASKQSI